MTTNTNTTTTELTLTKTQKFILAQLANVQNNIVVDRNGITLYYTDSDKVGLILELTTRTFNKLVNNNLISKFGWSDFHSEWILVR